MTDSICLATVCNMTSFKGLQWNTRALWGHFFPGLWIWNNEGFFCFWIQKRRYKRCSLFQMHGKKERLVGSSGMVCQCWKPFFRLKVEWLKTCVSRYLSSQLITIYNCSRAYLISALHWEGCLSCRKDWTSRCLGNIAGNCTLPFHEEHPSGNSWSVWNCRVINQSLCTTFQ